MSYVFVTVVAHADVDPSSALLLKNSSGQNRSGLNLDSGRYTIRPSTPPPATKVERQASDKTIERPASDKTVERPASDKTVERPASDKPTKPVQQNVVGPAPTSEAVTAQPTDETFPERMKEFFLGGDVEDILRYRGALNSQDARQNFVEVSVAPGLMYMDSKSDYWYRKFYSAGPGLGVGARFWLTPFFGLQSTYFTTFAADMTAQHDSNRKINADHRFFNAGMQFRKFFNMTRKSPNVLFGINYDENQLLVPKVETERVRNKNTGVSLRLEATVPSSNTKAWFYGVEFLPKVKVTELKTELDLKSGNKPTAYSTKFALGQDFTFNRNHKVFWRLSHRLDKVVYEGSANEPDPITTNTPEGVAVTQGTSLFQFGFTWGD